MATIQKLDWLQLQGGMGSLPEEQAGWRSLAVGDGQVAHEAALPEGITVPEALSDYASGYEDAAGQTVCVAWQFWEAGEMREEGSWSFTGS